MLHVLIVSGIWPPDVGGPASHGPQLGRFLSGRGHRVRAVASSPDGWPVGQGFPVRGVRRDQPLPGRLASALTTLIGAARGVDVIYSTGMYTRCAIAAQLNSVPLVVKLVNDPAFERARGREWFAGSVDEFQAAEADFRYRLLRRVRDLSLSRATRIITPGHYLARMGADWGFPSERFQVIPNPAAPADSSLPRDQLRERLGIKGTTFVFAGRYVRQKNVPLGVRAMRHVSDASLVLIGEGPEEAAIADAIEEAGVEDRVTVRPALPLEEALQWVRAADAAVLPSDWEGFPHAGVEALSVGTPLIATAVGAVPEIVQTGANGLLVEAGDEAALGAALQSLAADPELLGRLRDGAAATGDRYAPERTFSAIEDELERAVSEVNR